MLPDTIVTQRTRLRRWRDEDAAPMAGINRDPEVTRYLNRPVDEPAVAGFFDLVQAHWAQHGFGFYALDDARDPATPVFIGFVGVAYPAFLPELADRPELGWRLARASWGAGLASEAARAVRDHALSGGADELISIIHPDNARSRRLAAGLGMTVERQVHNPVLGRDVDVWAIGAAQSIASASSSRVTAVASTAGPGSSAASTAPAAPA